MTVRPAIANDVTFVAAAIRAAAKENATFAEVPVTTTDLRNHAARFISHPDTLLFVATEDDKPVGLILGQGTVYIGSSVPFIADVLLYVVPEKRTGGHASDLMAALTDEARKRNLHAINFPVVDSATAEAVNGLATKFGYTDKGRVYRLVL
ncbi:MAG: hypothetical protein DI640_12910 [Sphingomonas taxi]|uniref:N-acetyltransferase domain-containing protein n=1 Tax=Sphingomonas taxi TaxID=1549858 RepID=A0A2W4YXN3_9SPHN|nr:MAG: hypothetical protein DI640_12910 [Sphingomonas taxi]